MKVWICSTLANFLGPIQGPARLSAYIRAQGHDVRQKDFNQNAYFALLEKGNLERILGDFNYWLEMVVRSRSLRENIGAILTQSSNRALRRLLAGAVLRGSRFGWLAGANPVLGLVASRITPDNLLYALLAEKEAIVAEVEKARQRLDAGWLSLDPAEFLAGFRTLLCGKAIIDAAHFPAQLDFGYGLHGMAYGPTVRDILTATGDERHNFLIHYFRQHVLPELRAEQPGVIGISITHTGDLIPAFTLAALVKRENRDIHVTLGGATLTEVAYRIVKNRPLWDFFDSLVLGPGEAAFSALLEQVEKGQSPGKVPNVIYKEGGDIRQSEGSHEFDINDALTPEYVSVRPKSGLPLETSSGCYWGKCIFCYYPSIGTAGGNPQYGLNRVRRMELVLQDFSTMQRAYDPMYIGITDSCVTPQRLEQIAEHNTHSQAPVKFSAFIRFEPQFQSPQFCRKLAGGGFLGGQIGLESGCQRINDLINKGVDVKQAAVILKALHRAKILVHLYTVIGLPGETEPEARMTRDFIRKWHRQLMLGWQVYPLWVLEHGPLAQRARELGVTVRPFPDDVLVQITEYSPETGLTQDESYGLAVRYTEGLKRFAHPLTRVLDVETHKLFLLAEHAGGVPPGRLRRICGKLFR